MRKGIVCGARCCSVHGLVDKQEGAKTALWMTAFLFLREKNNCNRTRGLYGIFMCYLFFV